MNPRRTFASLALSLAFVAFMVTACNTDERADCVKTDTAIGEVCTQTANPDVSELEQIHEAEIAKWSDR